MPSIKKWRWAKKLPYGDGLSTDVSVPRTYGDEIDDLHKRVRRLADRVYELETFEHVSSLVAQSTSLELRRIR